MTAVRNTLQTRFVFVRACGTRHGELRRQTGRIESVSRAYLNQEGWLTFGGGAWLPPRHFVEKVEPRVPRFDSGIVRVIQTSMVFAQRLIGNDSQRARRVA